MSERAIMPLSDWQGILNAYRAKTETTDLIKSGELAALIAAIEAGEELTWAEGSFSSTEQISEYTIAHGLGVVPKIIIVRVGSSQSISSTYKYPFICGVRVPGFTLASRGHYASSSSMSISTKSETEETPSFFVTTADEENVTISSLVSSAGYIYSNKGYSWRVGG